ncbi:MAG: DUF503 domain-containing protein [Dehalococcoidia bacterium]
MLVGVLSIHLAIPADTLKEKRTVVKSVLERVRHRFNAAAAEVDALDDPGHARLAICCVSNEAKHLDSQLQTIANAVQEWRLDVEVLAIETEILTI